MPADARHVLQTPRPSDVKAKIITPGIQLAMMPARVQWREAPAINLRQVGSYRSQDGRVDYSY